MSTRFSAIGSIVSVLFMGALTVSAVTRHNLYRPLPLEGNISVQRAVLGVQLQLDMNQLAVMAQSYQYRKCQGPGKFAIRGREQRVGALIAALRKLDDSGTCNAEIAAVDAAYGKMRKSMGAMLETCAGKKGFMLYAVKPFQADYEAAVAATDKLVEKLQGMIDSKNSHVLNFIKLMEMKADFYQGLEHAMVYPMMEDPAQKDQFIAKFREFDREAFDLKYSDFFLKPSNEFKNAGLPFHSKFQKRADIYHRMLAEKNLVAPEIFKMFYFAEFWRLELPETAPCEAASMKFVETLDAVLDVVIEDNMAREQE